MTSKYHQSTFDLLGIEPKIDPARLETVQAKERLYNIAIDESVKDWLVLENIEDILKEHSSYFWVEHLTTFGDSEYVEGLDDEFNNLVKARKVIPLFHENLDGRLEWFLDPDGTNDPKVLLRTDMFPDFLMPHPHRFSKLIYLNIWDAQVQVPKEEGFFLKAKLGAVTEKELRLLRPNLDQKVSTFYLYATRTIHRFQKKDQFISIWDNSGQESIWYFHAKSSEALENLLRSVKDVQNIGQHIQLITTNDDNQANIKAKITSALIADIL